MAKSKKALIYGKSGFYPKQPACPMCANKVFEPHQFVVLSGGALKVTNRRLKAASGPHKDLWGFLEMTFHGAHDDGKAHDPELAGAHGGVMLADYVDGGQFEFYFCSTKCLRAFLNGQVDKLEDGLRVRARNRRGPKARNGSGPRDEIS